MSLYMTYSMLLSYNLKYTNHTKYIKMKLKTTPKQVRIPTNKITILERIAIEEDKTTCQVIRDAINSHVKKIS